MLKGKTALITGSTVGIGLAAARAFAAVGCNVVINGIEDAKAGGIIADAISKEFKTGALYHGADVGDHTQIEDMFGATVAKFGTVDIVVNNAGIRIFSPIDECSPEDWDRVLSVNLSAAFHTIRLSLPGMRARKWGRIINVSSVYGTFASRNRASYITTKAALEGLTRAVAIETVGSNITCNAVCPGAVNTTRSGQEIADMMGRQNITEQEAIQKFLVGRQPSGRFVEADNVAAMMVFLCSPASDDITASSFPIDGGWTASSGGIS